MKQPMNSLQDMGMLPPDNTSAPDGSSWGGQSKEYDVQQGDTVESICQQFGVQPNELAMLNNKAEDELTAMIQPGQKILVPDMTPTEPNQPVR
jgi:LysM repeat protein